MAGGSEDIADQGDQASAAPGGLCMHHRTQSLESGYRGIVKRCPIDADAELLIGETDQ